MRSGKMTNGQWAAACSNGKSLLKLCIFHKLNKTVISAYEYLHACMQTVCVSTKCDCQRSTCANTHAHIVYVGVFECVCVCVQLSVPHGHSVGHTCEWQPQ